jgi:hypothetical protein
MGGDVSPTDMGVCLGHHREVWTVKHALKETVKGAVWCIAMLAVLYILMYLAEIWR